MSSSPTPDAEDSFQPKPLKSRRVPIQLAKKRSSGTLASVTAPTTPSSALHREDDVERAIEATMQAAREASVRAETRRSRRSSRNDVISPPPTPVMLGSYSRMTSKRNTGTTPFSLDSPESKETPPEDETEEEMSQRHVKELEALRQAYAVAEAALKSRQESEAQTKAKSKRRKVTE